MNKHFLLLTSVLALSLPSLAAFNGQYSGQGEAVMHKSGKLRECSNIFLNLERQKLDLIKFSQGGYLCEDMQAGFPTFEIVIRNGKIFIHDSEAGIFSEKHIEIFYISSDEYYTYRLTLDETENGLEYKEEWTDDGQLALTVKGHLSKN